MRFLLYMGHPAHYHLLKHLRISLLDRGHEVRVLLKRKDVLEALLDEDRVPYVNVAAYDRGDTRAQIALALLRRDVAVWSHARRFRPDLMIGTSAEITHVGRALGIRSAVVNEDDAEVVPLLVRLAYPLADAVVAPDVCSVGRWTHKTAHYPGYHELAYLHPNQYQPRPEVAHRLGGGDRYALVRFAKLTAHHDKGRGGLSGEIAERLVKRLASIGRVYISSERGLEPSLEPYRIQIDPREMHDALAGASLYVGDSQTMAAEAAVLGTPSVRFNDFVGEIGYLDDLETTYGLTWGIRTSDPEALFDRVESLLGDPGLDATMAKRRQTMLNDKIDTTRFLTGFAESFAAGTPLAAARENGLLFATD